MTRKLPLILPLLLTLAGCARPDIDPAILAQLPETVDYNFHVKPILSDRCYKCHGPDENAREAGLRLDTKEGPYAAIGENLDHYAVVPGKPQRSELWRRITHPDPEERMPPAESNLSLSDYEIALLERWIEQGAEWKPHWAFIPPVKPAPPDVSDKIILANEIDRFIEARLERDSLTMSPEASKDVLLRRVTLDLTGLPPTIEELDEFLADEADDAYERAVDRLLDSPAYGERMASEWLDVARYADTGGYQSDRLRRMWPWRDWVISAFNDNLPFDEFLTWQLAGDLLPDPGPEQILATAFNRNHRQTEEGGSIEEEFRVEYAADRTNTTATAFMGMTMECARCHDHKYDPISQKDYYRFFGFFNNIDESGQTSYFTDAVPVPAQLLAEPGEQASLAQQRDDIARKEEERAVYIREARERFETWKKTISLEDLPAAPIAGLVAHLPLDILRGDKTPNARDSGNRAKTVYEPTTTEGRFGNAVSFDGENGIELGNVGNFTRSDPFSLSFWMKAGKWNDSNVLVHHTKAALDAGSRGYEVSLQADKLVAGLAHMWPNNAMRIVAKNGLPLDTWVHVAFTYDGSSKASGMRIYVDGALAEVDVVRDNLYRDIVYERQEVNLTLGYRFRDKGFQAGALDELRIFDRELTALEIGRLAGRETVSTDETLFPYFLARHDPRYRAIEHELVQLRQAYDALLSPLPEIMVMKEMTPRRPAYVLIRGAYDNKGEEVAPGAPERIFPLDESLPANRLGLARWLTDPAHPLTARVAVNRYWQLFFGRGLVSTTEDFGNQGALPSHPELLDWLATTFIESGWDVKALHRLIVTSAAFRQTSDASPALRKRDPQNVLLARGPAFRLTAEMLRDQALAAGGLLVRKMGGPPVKPYQPAGLWEEKSGQKYEQGSGDDLYRRSLYTFWKRTSPPPNMTTFDAAERNQCIVRRQRTSSPLQALVLLNDPQFVEASRKLAERLLLGEHESHDRIGRAFRLLTGRFPTDDEAAVLKRLLEEQRAEFADYPDDAASLLKTGESPSGPSLDATKLAALTMLVSTIMNSDAAVIRR